MQERHNSIANALELRLFCTNPSIRWMFPFFFINKSQNGRQYLLDSQFTQDGVADLAHVFPESLTHFLHAVNQVLFLPHLKIQHEWMHLGDIRTHWHQSRCVWRLLILFQIHLSNEAKFYFNRGHMIGQLTGLAPNWPITTKVTIQLGESRKEVLKVIWDKAWPIQMRIQVPKQ